MLVNKKSERTLNDLVHKQIRWGDRLPSTNPAHGDEAPVAAVKFDKSALQRGTIGHEFHQLQSRRHDFRDIARISVESKECLGRGRNESGCLEHARLGYFALIETGRGIILIHISKYGRESDSDASSTIYWLLMLRSDVLLSQSMPHPIDTF